MVKVKVEDIQNNETTDDYETKSESDNEEQEVVEAKTKKAPQQKTITCPNCNKEMLQKTFKYYHSIKCKPQQVEEPPTPARPEKIEVSFGVGRPIGRQVAKTENLQRLISKAF
jgi:hypothetical protein